MFLKIVLILIILYLLYRAFGGSFSLPKKAPKVEEDGDTLVECCKCGVYITKKEAKFKMGKYYCDECV